MFVKGKDRSSRKASTWSARRSKSSSKFLAALLFFLVVCLPWALFMLALRIQGGQPFDYRPLLSFFIALVATGYGLAQRKLGAVSVIGPVHMDYAGAILAFRMALSGANDETAYVYEQLGHCYERKNENKNAVAMYGRAQAAGPKKAA